MDLYYLGIDIGSTTVKTVLTDGERNIVFERYTRHYADIKTKLRELLNEAQETVGNCTVKTVITGSGGMQLADGIGVQFVQEVVASTKAVKTDYPQTDVAIELGGEDAKITYFKNGTEQRMNGTCAGGTGSFIDQMASLLQTDAQGLNELAKKHHTIYPIAARCGVFAKRTYSHSSMKVWQKRTLRHLFCSGCDSDHQRVGLRTTDSRQHCIFGRSALFSVRTAQSFYRNTEANRGTDCVPSAFPTVCRNRCGIA